MSNTTISWSNNSPADTDLVGQGDDAIRSLKSNVQGMLDAEHFFPAAGGAAGAHRRGSARVFVGARSEVSSADTDGRLMWNSSDSLLYYLDSSRSAVIGGRQTMLYGSSTFSANRYPMTDANVLSNLTSGVTNTFGFARNFATPPSVVVSLADVMTTTGVKVYAPVIASITTAGFQVFWHGPEGGSLSTATINWVAVGVAAYP